MNDEGGSIKAANATPASIPCLTPSTQSEFALRETEVACMENTAVG